mmetsp:Transcript_23976/g.65794  ORF Transcript_23976/g.65794 Transcript_23976/m.65794 type:complete len:239 (-) Transcript_23976:2862-3578(-)
MLHSQFQGLSVPPCSHSHLHSLVVVAITHEELRTPHVQHWIASRAQIIRDLAQHIKQLGSKAHVHSLAQLAALHVQSGCLLMCPLFIQVLGSIDHDGGRALKGQIHELLIQLVCLGQANSMAVTLCLGVVLDGLCNPVLSLILPCQVEGGRRVRTSCSNLLLSLLKVAGVAVHPYDGQHILGTVVAVQGLLDIPMALTVSPPPGCQLLVVTLACNILFQISEPARLEEHASNLHWPTT